MSEEDEIKRLQATGFLSKSEADKVRRLLAGEDVDGVVLPRGVHGPAPVDHPVASDHRRSGLHVR